MSENNNRNTKKGVIDPILMKREEITLTHQSVDGYSTLPRH